MSRALIISTIFFLVFVIKSEAKDIPSFTCAVRGNTCIFHNLNTTKDYPFFIPVADNDDVEIKELDLGGQHGSKMYTLTHDICNAFPKINQLVANHLDLVQINLHALERCTELVSLNFEHNSIDFLPPFVFNTSQYVRKLKLGHNQLIKLHPQALAGLVNLEDLDIRHNKLKYFPDRHVAPLPSLWELHISNNALTDFPVDFIHRRFPNLTYIHLQYNIIACDRRRVLQVRFDHAGIGVFFDDRCDDADKVRVQFVNSTINIYNVPPIIPPFNTTNNMTTNSILDSSALQSQGLQELLVQLISKINVTQIEVKGDGNQFILPGANESDKSDESSDESEEVNDNNEDGMESNYFKYFMV